MLITVLPEEHQFRSDASRCAPWGKSVLQCPIESLVTATSNSAGVMSVEWISAVLQQTPLV